MMVQFLHQFQDLCFFDVGVLQPGLDLLQVLPGALLLDQAQGGAALVGPAIIEEQTSTTVLVPGQHGKVDEYQSIKIRFGAPT